MPAPRRSQTNTTLYTVVAFVAIAVIATVAAVIFYVKYQNQRSAMQQLQTDFSEMVSRQDWRRIASIVGEKKNNETYLGKMNDYLKQMLILTVGGPLEENSAQILVDSAIKRCLETVGKLAEEPIGIADFDPNTTGLVRIIEKLAEKLTLTSKRAQDLEKKLDELHKQFEDFQTVSFEKEQQLLAEVQRYKKQVENVTSKYKALEEELKKTTDERIDAFKSQLEQVSAERKKLNDELNRTRARLDITRRRLEKLQKQLWKIEAPPDKEVAAYKPDGKVILVDNQIIHINIGSSDHVYRGLTFAVYDKSSPIPRSGKGKAEIQVFDVKPNVSAARLIYSEKRRPVVQDDIVANLIWDSSETNIFTVAGEFDLDNDGNPDRDGVEKIKELIEKWGGKVTDNVTVDTDFVVLGKPPQLPPAPSADEMEIDPQAQQRYNAAKQKRRHYEEVKAQAEALWIPVFNTERFLYFIGYKQLSSRADAF